MAHEENNIKRQITDYLELLGWFVVPLNNTIKYGGKVRTPYKWKPGVPDILAINPTGMIIFIETKRPKGRHEKGQIIFQKECNKRCVVYILARSLQDVQAVIG